MWIDMKLRCSKSCYVELTMKLTPGTSFKGKIIILITLLVSVIKCDNPCAARDVGGESVVCVCNKTYCDTITKEIPASNQCIVYTSSKAGSRLRKTYVPLVPTKDASYCPVTLILDPSTQYQKIKGFGGAITDSAAINWLSLPSPELRQHLIDSYFSDRGIEYSVVRVPIGGTDFSLHKYGYNEQPEDDIFLSNFTLTDEDFYLKIPMIKAAFAASSRRVLVLATTWAPPGWMTEVSNYTTCGRIKKKYYGTFAEYHLRFLEEYDAQGIPVWGITTSNEPANGFLPFKKFNCLAWTAHTMGIWIGSYLGPMIRGSRFCDIKILGMDDQRQTIPLWFIAMLEEYPAVVQYLDGIALHFYANFFAPPEQMLLISRRHPDMFIMSTEACEGTYPWQTLKVDLGSWDRAVDYINNIIADLNYNVVGWLDWNICLNEEGGPAWNNNYVDSPIIVASKKGEFYKNPMFYAFAHVSKFVPRGSRRIGVKVVDCNIDTRPEQFSVSEIKGPVDHVSFKTPDGYAVLLRNNGEATTVNIHLGNNRAVVDIEAMSIVTIVFGQK